MTDDDVVLTLPARELALAWLNVGLASIEQPDRPALHLTHLVEVFGSDRCRLVATDSCVLIRSFVAEEFTDEPLLEEAPTSSFVVADLEGRMAAMCRWLVKITKPKRDQIPPAIDVRVTLVDLEPDPDEPTLMPEMAAQGLQFDAEVEQVTLPIIETPYPEWRWLGDVLSEPAESIVFAQRYLGLFGSLRNPVEGVRLTFAADRPTQFVGGTYPQTFGLLMPMRQGAPEQEASDDA